MVHPKDLLLGGCLFLMELVLIDPNLATSVGTDDGGKLVYLIDLLGLARDQVDLTIVLLPLWALIAME